MPGREKAYFRVRNTTRDTTLAERATKVDTFIRRGIGLIGRKGLPESGGLIIEPCSSVVSFFMRFPIDVVFLDESGKVRHVVEHMVPWRTSRIVRGARR